MADNSINNINNNSFCNYDYLRQNVIINLNKIYSSNSLPIGTENLKKLISANYENYNEKNLLLILGLINNKIIQEQRNDKKEFIKLLSILISSAKEISEINTTFLSKVLTVLQSNINLSNQNLFSIIVTTFSDILDFLFLKDDDILLKSEYNNQIIKIYELTQGFCIYNIKQNDKSCNIVGSLCLNSLIRSCPLVLKNCYLNYIWKNIMFYLDIKNIQIDKSSNAKFKSVKSYPAKIELLNTLISLIFACENNFSYLANKTLNNILDYLNSEDWIKRKLSLNVIYAISTYCMADIISLRENIINCLKVLKNDKIKEVRDVSIETLKLFMNTKSEEKNINSKNNNINQTKDNNSKNFKELLTNNIDLNNLLNDNNNNNNYVNYNNKIASNNNSNINNSYNIDYNEETSLKDTAKFKENTNNSKMHRNNLKDKNINKNMNDKEKQKNINRVQSVKEEAKFAIDSINKISKEFDRISNVKLNSKSNEKHVTNSKSKDRSKNGRYSNKYVNSKMEIKQDPNYSIFNTQKNSQFFSNNSFINSDIQIKYKENKNKKGNNNINNKDINCKKSITEEKNNNYIYNNSPNKILKCSNNNDDIYYSDKKTKNHNNLNVNNSNASNTNKKIDFPYVVNRIKEIFDKQAELTNRLSNIQSNQNNVMNNFIKRINLLEIKSNKLNNVVKNNNNDCKFEVEGISINYENTSPKRNIYIKQNLHKKLNNISIVNNVNEIKAVSNNKDTDIELKDIDLEIDKNSNMSNKIINDNNYNNNSELLPVQINNNSKISINLKIKNLLDNKSYNEAIDFALSNCLKNKECIIMLIRNLGNIFIKYIKYL